MPTTVSQSLSQPSSIIHPQAPSWRMMRYATFLAALSLACAAAVPTAPAVRQAEDFDGGGVKYEPLRCSQKSDCGCNSGYNQCSRCPDDGGSANQFADVCWCSDLNGLTPTGNECNPAKDNGPYWAGNAADDCDDVVVQTAPGTPCGGDGLDCGILTKDDSLRFSRWVRGADRPMKCDNGICIPEDDSNVGATCAGDTLSSPGLCGPGLNCIEDGDGVQRCLSIVGSGTACGSASRDGFDAVFIRCPADHRCEQRAEPNFIFDKYCTSDLVAGIGETCTGGISCEEGAGCRPSGGKNNGGTCLGVAASGEACGQGTNFVCQESEIRSMSSGSCIKSSADPFGAGVCP